MYNRYLPNDRGVYAPFEQEAPPPAPPPPPPAAPGRLDPARLLSSLTGRLRSFETADLLLVLLLLFLYEEQADDELLLALGLLLIL